MALKWIWRHLQVEVMKCKLCENETYILTHIFNLATPKMNKKKVTADSILYLTFS